MVVRRKVCMLIPSYFPRVGGSEVQLAGLLRRLDRARVEPFVLTRRLAGTLRLDREGDTLVVRRRAPLRAGTFFFSSLEYLWRHRADYDVLHVHSMDSPAFAGAIIKHFFPEKTYVQLVPRFGDGSSYDRLTKSALGRARLRFVMRKADAIIPLCPDASVAIAGLGLPREKVADIPNGVDTERFAPLPDRKKAALRRSVGISETAFVGVIVARLIERKNVLGALAAWKSLTVSHPDAVLIVCGDGPEMPRLQQYYREHMPRGSVILNGNTPRDGVVRFLQCADAYLSFSASEGMSNAMLEAMSTGLPVVAARGPGIDQLISDGQTGYLFTAIDDAARKLERLAAGTEERSTMSRAARAAIEARFSFDRVAREVETLYCR